MNWIAEHLKVLRTTVTLCALAAGGIVIGLSGRQGTIERWQVGLLALPWLLGFGAGLPLVYHSWMKNTRKGVMRTLLTAFFWCWVLASAVVFGGIYGRFVLGVF